MHLKKLIEKVARFVRLVIYVFNSNGYKINLRTIQEVSRAIFDRHSARAMKRLMVFSGSTHPEITEKIVKNLGIKAGLITTGKYANNETRIMLDESVRGADVYLVQTSSAEVNDALMELLIMIHTCRISSAGRITAVMPIFPYSRQEKLVDGRGPITAKLVANMLSVAGADQIITMDLHASQIQGFFDIPVENLSSQSAVEPWIRKNIPDWSECVIVAPDAGGIRRATFLARMLELQVVLLHKERNKPNEILGMTLVGDVHNKSCIILDDIADTCGTLVSATNHLLKCGAKTVYAVVVHGIFSNQALDLITKSHINKFAVTNTIPLKICPNCQTDNIQVIDVSHIFSESIRRTHSEGSVMQLSVSSHRL